MMRILMVLWMCVGLGSLAQAQVYPEYTSTTVNDVADLLPDAAEARVSKVLRDLKTTTGVEMTLLTLSSTAPYLGDLSIPDYATNLFNTWGIGDSSRNDGVLVLIFRQDREMRIALGSGYGLEWDRAAKEAIERGFILSFRKDDYAGGIEIGIQQTIDRVVMPFLGGEDAPAAKSPFDWGQIGIFAFVASIFGLVLGKKPFDRYRLRHSPCPQCGQIGGLAKERKTTQSATRSTTGRGMQTMTCSNCSYRDQTPYTISRIRSSSSGGFGGGRSSGGGASGKW